MLYATKGTIVWRAGTLRGLDYRTALTLYFEAFGIVRRRTKKRPCCSKTELVCHDIVALANLSTQICPREATQGG